MSPTIGNAPLGQDSSVDETEKFPVSGSKYMLISTVVEYLRTKVQTLTNKTLTAPVISTISNTGTLTLPTSTDTLVGRATTDSLTNKTADGTNNLINNLTADTTPDRTADYVRTYDASAGSEKKVLLGKAGPVVIRFETFTSTNDPADSTTYYFGPFANQGLSTTLADYVKLYVPVAGTVTKVEVLCVAVAYGTSETSTLSLRLNNTSDTTITSALTNNALFRAQTTGLSVTVALGDYFAIKWVTPAWVTNPTDVGFVIQVVIE